MKTGPMPTGGEFSRVDLVDFFSQIGRLVNFWGKTLRWRQELNSVARLILDNVCIHFSTHLGKCMGWEFFLWLHVDASSMNTKCWKCTIAQEKFHFVITEDGRGSWKRLPNSLAKIFLRSTKLVSERHSTKLWKWKGKTKCNGYVL